MASGRKRQSHPLNDRGQKRAPSSLSLAWALLIFAAGLRNAPLGFWPLDGLLAWAQEGLSACFGDVLQLPAVGAAEAPATGGRSAEDAFRQLEAEARGPSEAEEEVLPPEVLANTIDKRRIAEQAIERAIGLRERGNPHIPRSILLGELKVDPGRSRIDPERLREDRIRAYERTLAAPADSRPEGSDLARATGQLPAKAKDSAPTAAERPAKRRAVDYIVLFGSSLLVTLGIILYWRR